MAATGTPTPNIGLRIPLGTDPASVDDINYNSNLIDTKLGAVGNDSVQDQIDDLNSKITNLVKNKTFSDTTNSDGNIVVDLSSNNKIILGITTSNTSVMYYFGITSGGNIVVHFNNTAGASYASQSVSGAVWYIETA